MDAHHRLSKASQVDKGVLRYLSFNIKGVKDKTSVVGELQELVISAVIDSGLTRFSIKDVTLYLERRGIKIDRRRVHDALQRLLKRGYVVKLARGFYSVLREKIHELYVNGVRLNRKTYARVKDSREVKDKHEYEGASFANGGNGDGLFGRVYYDNVRGYLLSGSYVYGDRAAWLSSEDLARFDSVSYAEFRVFSRVTIDVLDYGYFVIYKDAKSGLPVVEFRPYANFVKRFGVVAVERTFRKGLIEVWLALSSVVSDLHSRGSFVRFLRRLLRGWWPEFKGLIVTFAKDVIGGMDLRELADVLCSNAW